MDTLDRIVTQWAEEKPHLNTLPMSMIGRLIRITKHLEGAITEAHREHDLKMGEFDVLATLRRSGEPYQLTPSALLDSLLLTSGAMTNRLDRLVEKQLIVREHSQLDRRSVYVKLTDAGLKLIDVVIEQHVLTQQSITRSLNDEQQQELNQLLKIWLGQFE
jgi:DNA-binding MarR family transcriptional regulator